MAENTAEVEATVNAAFGAGFGVIPPAEAPPAKVDGDPAAEPGRAGIAAPPAPVPEKPQYIRLTKQEWDNTKAAAGKVSTLESQIAKLMGNAPNADRIAQQVIDRVRSETPAGLSVEVTDEDFAELAADFPELAKSMRAALERTIKKAQIKGTGPAEAAQPVDVNAAVEQALMKREEAALAKAYPDWTEIVAKPKASGDVIPADNPFRVWLSQQAPEYQKEINETNSYADIMAAITKFKTATASPSPKPDKAAARRALIADAVTPRADGSPPPLNTPQSAEEAFGAGFKAAKAR